MFLSTLPSLIIMRIISFVIPQNTHSPLNHGKAPGTTFRDGTEMTLPNQPNGSWQEIRFDKVLLRIRSAPLLGKHVLGCFCKQKPGEQALDYIAA